MGGTSTDVALIHGGVPQVSAELTIDYGLPIHVPMVDVKSVGAGGGSIASINAAGMLQVGPQSAGSDPGPSATAAAAPSPPSPTPTWCWAGWTRSVCWPCRGR